MGHEEALERPIDGLKEECGIASVNWKNQGVERIIQTMKVEKIQSRTRNNLPTLRW